MRRPAVTLAGYALALVAVFVAAWTLGAAVGPHRAPAELAAHGELAAHDTDQSDADRSDADRSDVPVPAVLPEAPLAPARGYRLEIAPALPVEFRVIAPDGTAFARFDRGAGIVLTVTRTDLPAAPQALNAGMTPDGSWHTTLSPRAGTHRLRVDFTPEGGFRTSLTGELPSTR